MNIIENQEVVDSEYSNWRYLDALACLFAIHSDCTAISVLGSKSKEVLIAFNKHLPSDANEAKLVKSKVKCIETFINNLDITLQG